MRIHDRFVRDGDAALITDALGQFTACGSMEIREGHRLRADKRQLLARPELADTHRETMHKHGQDASLRTAWTLGKDAGHASPHKRCPWLPLLAAATACLLSACHLGPREKTVRLADLEHAPPAVLARPQRVGISDPEALRELCSPLGPRLGLLQVRSVADWNRLARIAPALGRCPDLQCGIVIGLACWAGTPLDGRWSIHIAAVRVHDGAGLIQAEFQGGTFQPDGTAILETAHVPGLAAVLAAEVNGTTFCPE